MVNEEDTKTNNKNSDTNKDIIKNNDYNNAGSKYETKKK